MQTLNDMNMTYVNIDIFLIIGDIEGELFYVEVNRVFTMATWWLMVTRFGQCKDESFCKVLSVDTCIHM